MAASGGTAAGWYDDPSGRYSKRYWNGADWTEHVADAAGATSTDPIREAPVQPTSTAAVDEAEVLRQQLERAMVGYGELLEEAKANGMDDSTFRGRALRIGLIVRETDVWLLDVPSGRWFRYDGVALSPLGGWGETPPPAEAAKPRPKTQARRRGPRRSSRTPKDVKR